MEENGKILVIEDGRHELKQREFASDDSIREVKIPGSVREIGSNAFAYCANLESVEIAEGLEVIREWAFTGCPKLKRVKLPSTLRLIESRAFLECTGLEEIVLPDCLCQIGYKAFSGCNGLKRVSIPASLVKVGGQAFACCKGLERVDIHSTIQSDIEHGSCFFQRFTNYYGAEIFKGCTALREVVVHEGVTEIPFWMFAGCGNIETILLPSTLKWVKKKAFSAYAGRPILMPKGIALVTEDAFGKYNLKAIVPGIRAVKGFGALKFGNGGYQKVADFLVEGERRLAEEPLDVNGFCKWLLEEPGVAFGDGEDDSRLVLLEAMKGYSRLLRGSAFAQATDETVSVWRKLFRFKTVETGTFNENVSGGNIPQFFGEVLRHDCRDEADRRRKIAVVTMILSKCSGWMSDFWSKSAGRGRLSPMFEAVSVGNAELRGNLERIWRLMRCSANFSDGNLRLAAKEGRLGEFMLRLPLCGLKMDSRVIAKLFKCHSAKCIVAAYKNNGELEKEIPLGLVLLAVCQSWPSEKAVEFVKCVEAAFPGLCASTLDAAECSPLWYCLYNGDCQKLVDMYENPLVSALIEVGCDSQRQNRFGLSFDAIKEDFKRVFRAEYLEAFARPSRPMGLPRPAATMPPAVVQKPSYAARPIDAGTAREACPQGFVNALQYAVGGVIDSWRCAGAADIVQLWIPAEVKNIGNCAFKGCPSLEEVLFENCGAGEQLNVGRMAFADCPKLTRVKLSERLVSLADGAFRDCGAFAECSIPQHGAIQVGAHAFDNCPDRDGKMALLS